MKETWVKNGRFLLAIAMGIGFIAMSSLAVAQNDDPSAGAPSPRPPRQDRDDRNHQRDDRNFQRGDRAGRRSEFQRKELDSQTREELRAFVREHVPELERMLVVLNERRPAQFQQAIHSINDSYARLQAIKKSGNEARYRHALENWKIDARIKMIAAQLVRGENPALENRLKRLINRQMDERLIQLKEERARTQKQLERLDSSVLKYETEREQEVERRFQDLLRQSQKMQSERESGRSPKPANQDKRTGNRPDRENQPTETGSDQDQP